MDRIQALQDLLNQDPLSTFARYGLAIEYSKTGRLDEAIAEFRKLIEHNPDYCAAYYHGGKALEQARRPEEARAMYEQGITAARRTGDDHTRSELEAALDLLPRS